MFSKKNKDFNEDYNLVKIAALLVHTAKIDENYSAKEEDIIRQALLKIGANNNNINEILRKGNEIENNSNQILEFTKEVKNMDEINRLKIVETLWRIIYSNKIADMYEDSLMRRLKALLYIDNKIMGDIKDKIKKENS